MKTAQYFIFAIAALVILSTSAQAVPVQQTVPDTASTMGLLGGAVAGLAGLRMWLKK